MAGQPQKARELLQDQRAERIERRPETVLPGEPRDVVVPKPPRGLLKITRELWADFWQSPVAVIVRASDRAAVERWARLVDQHERFTREYRRRPFVPGYKGQPKRSPAYDMAMMAASEIRMIEDRLGMNPVSRMRLGLALIDQADALDEMNARLAGDDDAVEWVEG